MMDIENFLGSLDEDQLAAVLSRIQASGYIERQGRNQSNTNAYGGRLGYSQPLGKGNLLLGISGEGYNYKEPHYKERAFGLSGIDASYNQNSNTYGVNFTKDPRLGNALQLFYQKDF